MFKHFVFNVAIDMVESKSIYLLLFVYLSQLFFVSVFLLYAFFWINWMYFIILFYVLYWLISHISFIFNYCFSIYNIPA